MILECFFWIRPGRQAPGRS